MQAKVFDPFTEDAVNGWLAETPVKVIYSASVFDTKLDARERQVALVFYEEEHAIGAHAAVTAPEDAFTRLLDRMRGEAAAV